jgi:hypothetical protein
LNIRRFNPSLALLIALAAASSLRADDVIKTEDRAYPIKFHVPGHKGERETLEAIAAVSRTMHTTWDHRDDVVSDDKNIFVIDLQADAELLEVTDSGNPTALKLRIAKLTKTTADHETSIAPAGAVVMIREKKDDVEVTVDGKPLDADDKPWIAYMFGMRPGGDHSNADEIMGSKTPRHVGESWSGNTDAIAASMAAEGYQAKKDTIKCTTTLEAVEPHDSVECLRIKVDYSGDMSLPADYVAKYKLDVHKFSSSGNCTYYLATDPAKGYREMSQTASRDWDYDGTRDGRPYHCIATDSYEIHRHVLRDLPPSTRPSTAPDTR